MRKQGRRPILPRETIDKMVQEYLTTDKSAAEVGEEYGVSGAMVAYHTRLTKRR